MNGSHFPLNKKEHIHSGKGLFQGLEPEFPMCLAEKNIRNYIHIYIFTFKYSQSVLTFLVITSLKHAVLWPQHNQMHTTITLARLVLPWVWRVGFILSLHISTVLCAHTRACGHVDTEKKEDPILLSNIF